MKKIQYFSQKKYLEQTRKTCKIRQKLFVLYGILTSTEWKYFVFEYMIKFHGGRNRMQWKGLEQIFAKLWSKDECLMALTIFLNILEYICWS